MTATIASMPNPFNLSSDGGVVATHAVQDSGMDLKARPSPMGSRSCEDKTIASGVASVAPGPSETFLPGLQIGDAGQQLDAVRFMHEIMPPGCEKSLADDLPVHRPIFLSNRDELGQLSRAMFGRALQR